jgi:hypothetical protein
MSTTLFFSRPSAWLKGEAPAEPNTNGNTIDESHTTHVALAWIRGQYSVYARTLEEIANTIGYDDDRQGLPRGEKQLYKCSSSTTNDVRSAKSSRNEACMVASSCPPEDHAFIDYKEIPTRANINLRLATSSRRGRYASSMRLETHCASSKHI